MIRLPLPVSTHSPCCFPYWRRPCARKHRQVPIRNQRRPCSPSAGICFIRRLPSGGITELFHRLMRETGSVCRTDAERDVSLTTTLFFGFRPEKNTYFYFDPEIAGRGFSGVNGLANSSNGELPRVAAAEPKPYLARLYVSHDFGFGSRKDFSEADENQLAGRGPPLAIPSRWDASRSPIFSTTTATRTIRARSSWGGRVMYNGAWDYPADMRGYTWGWVHEFHTRNWSVRYGSGASRRSPTACVSTAGIFRDRGDVVEGEYRFSRGRSIRARCGCSGSSITRTPGRYADALRLAERRHARPDITATRECGHAASTAAASASIRKSARMSACSGAWAGTTARPRASPSPPSTGWPRAACPSPARAGIVRTISRGERADGERALRRARAVSGARRSRLSDRRRRAAIRPGDDLGKLLQRALCPGSSFRSTCSM